MPIRPSRVYQAQEHALWLPIEMLGKVNGVSNRISDNDPGEQHVFYGLQTDGVFLEEHGGEQGILN